MDRIAVQRGDITKLAVECIVNAANSALAGGGGVDGAIHRAAGPRLAAACRRIGGCPTGEARLTEGYDLPARWVIHAVGPIYRDGRHGEPALLAACYRNALSLALTHEVRTIAFPAISCGVYGYPVAEAATIAVREVAGFLEHDTTFEQIVFCCFSVDVELAYLEAMEEIESP
jgi:O-acetyl-ADP-ribose deacetylase